MTNKAFGNGPGMQFVSSELRAAWNAADMSIGRSFEAKRRELNSLCCDSCGVPFRIVPHSVGAAEISYRCTHGPESVQ